MSVEPRCPTCGAPVLPGQIPVEPPASSAVVPSNLLVGPGSDDTNVVSYFDPMATMAEPDPILGEFIMPSSSEVSLPEEAHSGLLSQSHAHLGALASIEFSLMPHPARFQPVPAQIQESDEPTVDLGKRFAWPMVLIGSYASAVTLAMAWLLLGPNGRLSREPIQAPPVSVEAEDPGRQAGLSRKVEPTGPIPADQVLTIGKSHQVGALEVTPIEVSRRSVTLERPRISNGPERRAGGNNSLVLKLLIKNTSKDLVFAPIDPTFVREHGRGIVETYVEASDNERIYPFDLAVESEWSIVGQDFAELRPGESRMALIATKPDAPSDAKGPFTWRIKLRTGLDQTDVIGVRWPDKPSSKEGNP